MNRTFPIYERGGIIPRDAPTFYWRYCGPAGPRSDKKKILKELKDEFNFDLVIANGENLSEGNGMTLKHAEAMHLSGIDYFTSGNHIWKQKEVIQLLDSPSP